MPFSQNSVGWEQYLATNYLGPFALTGLLLPLLEARGARIVTVGSLANRRADLPAEDLYWRAEDYTPTRAYARSKLALLSFTLELKGAPARARVHRCANDVALAQRVWSSSEALTGVRFLSDSLQRGSDS